jgi:hypothetical protein
MIAVVRAFLIGYTVLVVVGCAGMRLEAPEEEQGHTESTKKQGHTEATEEEQTHSPGAPPEEARCEGTRTIDLPWGPVGLTNDVPGCPNGGVLSGTDGRDKLDGQDGEDKVRGLGGSDQLWGGFGRDVIYGGPGNDFLVGSTVNEDGQDRSKDVLYGGPGRDDVVGMRGDDVLYGGDDKTVYGDTYKDDLYGGLHGGGGEDVLYGGDGNDFLDASLDGQRDKLFCGEGKDEYAADKIDYVSSSCEVKTIMGRA